MRPYRSAPPPETPTDMPRYRTSETTLPANPRCSGATGPMTSELFGDWNSPVPTAITSMPTTMTASGAVAGRLPVRAMPTA